MFGSQMLVAPLLEKGNSRTVYLPKGKWIDYQTNKVYDGGYQTIAVPLQNELVKGISKNPIPCIILVRDGTTYPQSARGAEHRRHQLERNDTHPLQG